MQKTDLKLEFISEYGEDVYEEVKNHAGAHAIPSGVVTVEDLPEDDDQRFLYSLVEIAEYECGKDESECDIPLSDDDVFHFLLRHYAEVARELETLPPRGANQYRQDLRLIYPFHDAIDLHVEIESETSDDTLGPMTVLGRDRRSSDDVLLVCLMPCTTTVNDSEDIPKKYPVERGIPQFDAEIESPVEVIIPVPKSVWQITADISPGFMTLDGWDFRNDEEVKSLVGVVSSANPAQSRNLLDKLLGDDDEWMPPE